MLNGGETVDETSVGAVLPQLKDDFSRLGYMETSSADLFDQFLKTGVGAKPMIAGYESQLLEFSVQNPEEYETLKEDIVMLYPTPTIWSTHVLIALDDPGEQLISALLDEKVQALAWEKHGFRTSLYSAASECGDLPGRRDLPGDHSGDGDPGLPDNETNYRLSVIRAEKGWEEMSEITMEADAGERKRDGRNAAGARTGGRGADTAGAAAVDEIKKEIDFLDPQTDVQYGVGAQRNIADFSQRILGQVRTKEQWDGRGASAGAFRKGA